MTLTTRLAIAMIALVAIAVTAVGWLSYRNLEQALLLRARDRIETHSRQVATDLEYYAASATGDVAGFRSATALQGLVRARRAGGTDPANGISEQTWRDRLASRFAAELEAKPIYAMFRFIGLDDDGREIVRVDRNGPNGTVRIVPEAQLQKGSNRGYFQETVRLGPTQIYVSPLDLGRYNGLIEEVHRPTLRVATPIFADDGKPFGIFMINVDMRRAFDRVRSSVWSGETIYVVNKQGDYLIHPDRSREFGWLLGKPNDWKADFPRLASHAGTTQSSADTVSDQNAQSGGIALAPALLAGVEWVGVIETAPHAIIMAPAASIRNTSLLVGAIAVLCAAALAFLVARSLTRPIVQLTEAVESVAQKGTAIIPVDAGGETGVLARAFARVMDEVDAKTVALEREIVEHLRTEAAREHHAGRERLFSAAVESSNDAIITQSLDGLITGWNPAAERLYGYTTADAVGRHISLIVPADRLTEVNDIVRRISWGETIEQNETVRLQKDGTSVEVALSISPIKAASGAIIGISKTAHDITERNRTLQTLRQQAEERRLIFEVSQDLLMVLDSRGYLVQISASCETILGYRPEEMIGRSAKDFIHPDDIEKARAEMRAARRGERMRICDTRWFHKDGHPVWLSWLGAWSAPVKRFFFVSRDMTETNRTQRALQQQIEERRRIFETSQDLILVTNARGILVQVSPSSAAILGYSPEEMLGRSALDFTYAEDIERANQEARAEGQGRQSRNYVSRCVHKDGRIVTLSWMGTWSAPVRRFFYIGRDMTDSHKAQEVLRESEQMARGIIETSLDAFVQVDQRGVVRDWNAQAETLFGWSREEALGQSIFEMMGRSDAPGPLQMALEGFLRSGAEQIRKPRREIQARRRDGQQFTAEISVTALKTRDGFVFNSFIRDLTDKVATEERIRQAEKMEAMGQLTGGIAHDFNNILTVITGTIEILADAVKEDPQLAAITRMIDEAASRGADLTQHLLAFARKQPLEPRETDVNGLIIDTAKLLQRTLGEQVEIESVFEEEICPAIVDPNQLATALLNLALNARDAMPDGGKLVIETGLVVLDENYARITGDVRPGSYAMIAVSDTGTGIPAGIIDRVFDPFFTSKGPGKGTGLGLSMVYGFIKQSAGHIKIYSEEGHGTTVKMYLPPASGASLTAGPTLAPELVGGHETILVVEDDKLVRDYVLTQLHSLGYVTLDAANASEALAMVKSGAAFDLLFTDVIMPGLNGRQLADEILKIMPGLKVLFTSGYTENAIIHHGRLDEGVLLLAKPYRKSDMAIMIRKALAE